MMNRRDTILIAVLINAGLLVILFATAITGESQVEAPTPIVEATPVDEVEEVLSRYVQEAPVVVVEKPSLPEPKIAPVEAPKPSYVEVTVKRGDSLDKIARQNGTTIAALMQINGLTDSRLQIGQVLRVLKGQAQKSIPSPVQQEGYYVIESGDNPWLLASKLQIPLNDLLELNNLDEERARRLKPGDRIRIK